MYCWVVIGLEPKVRLLSNELTFRLNQSEITFRRTYREYDHDRPNQIKVHNTIIEAAKFKNKYDCVNASQKLT